MEAIQEQVDQQPEATEAIEDEMVSTNDNDANKTNEMDERTQDISNTNEDINDDMGGNSNEVVEESEKAIHHEEEP